MMMLQTDRVPSWIRKQLHPDYAALEVPLPVCAVTIWQQEMIYQLQYALDDAHDRYRFLCYLLAEGTELKLNNAQYEAIAWCCGAEDLAIHYCNEQKMEQTSERYLHAQEKHPPEYWPAQHSVLSDNKSHAISSFISEIIPTIHWPDGFILPPLTRSMALYWEDRLDLQERFPHSDPRFLQGYIRWLILCGRSEHMIHDGLFEAITPWMNQLIENEAGIPITNGMVFMLPSFFNMFEMDMQNRWKTDRVAQLTMVSCYLTLEKKHDLPGVWFRYPKAWMANEVTNFKPFPINHVMVLAWLQRQDVSKGESLNSTKNKYRLICWFLLHGMEELHLHTSHLPGTIGEWLLQQATPSFKHMELCLYYFSHELQKAFDLTTPTGEQHFRQWLREHGTDQLLKLQQCAKAPPTQSTIQPSAFQHYAVCISGFLTRTSGIGQHALLAIEALKHTDLEFITLDKDTGDICSRDGDKLDPDVPYRVDLNLQFMNADYALYYHSFKEQLGVRAATTIGCWHWELGNMPKEWLHAYNYVDEVWAFSSFTAQSFRASSSKPVLHMPMPVMSLDEEKTVSPQDLKTFGLTQYGYSFLYSFDFNSFIARKNPHAAVQAFAKAFPKGSEEVSLIFKTINAKKFPKLYQQLQTLSNDDPRVQYVDRKLSREDMLSLIASCDAYVSPHRSEGFGLGPAQAMFLQKPVIATDFSSTQDFVNAQTGYPVAYTLIPVGEGEYPGFDGQVWADVDTDQAAQIMKQLAQHPDQGVERGKQAFARILEQYHLLSVAKAYAERISQCVHTPINLNSLAA